MPERSLVIYYAFCLDVAEGRMNETPNETLFHEGLLVLLVNDYTTWVHGCLKKYVTTEDFSPGVSERRELAEVWLDIKLPWVESWRKNLKCTWLANQKMGMIPQRKQKCLAKL